MLEQELELLGKLEIVLKECGVDSHHEKLKKAIVSRGYETSSLVLQIDEKKYYDTGLKGSIHQNVAGEITELLSKLSEESKITVRPNDAYTVIYDTEHDMPLIAVCHSNSELKLIPVSPMLGAVNVHQFIRVYDTASINEN
ncbi:hypothetical protein HOK51_02565 [Candidatus Woesearchaeota archaeon]|jgi:hypothetical protein|nr:hypothetical protein [Candidatus Woesearchaeota archaeon]MBT6518701.1 hypothetical protein [Candidatus Woesearchaeota archaeon]MBT7368377.1 hypothetical protein [Candidatus Woesearchaeota archaeon]